MCCFSHLICTANYWQVNCSTLCTVRSITHTPQCYFHIQRLSQLHIHNLFDRPEHTCRRRWLWVKHSLSIVFVSCSFFTCFTHFNSTPTIDMEAAKPNWSSEPMTFYLFSPARNQFGNLCSVRTISSS